MSNPQEAKAKATAKATKYVILHDRADRRGSNFVVKLGAFIYGTASKADIYHNPQMPYGSSIFMKPFIKYSRPICKGISRTKDIRNTPGYVGGVRGHQSSVIPLIREDLVSYFSKHLKKEFFQLVQSKAHKKKFKLPWKNNTKIHLRLDDQWAKPDYDGSGSANYITDLINNDVFHQYKRKKLLSLGQDHQVCIDPTKLANMVKKLKAEHPNKEVMQFTVERSQKKWLMLSGTLE